MPGAPVHIFQWGTEDEWQAPIGVVENGGQG